MFSLVFVYSCSEETEESAEHQELRFIAAKKKIFEFMAEEEPAKAEKVYDTLKYTNTKNYTYYFLGGMIKEANGKHKDAIGLFMNAMGIYETEEAHLNLAQIYRELNDSALFISSIQRLIEINPNDARYYVEYAEYFAAQKVYLIAIENMSKAINFGTSNNKPGYYVRRGDLRQEFGDLRGAIADYDSAIALDQYNCLAHIQKTATFLNDGFFKEAIKSANEGLKNNCDKGHLIFRRGVARFMLNDVLGAKEDILLALELQNEEAINYIKHTAPIGFKVLFPIKYREQNTSLTNAQTVVVSRDECLKWKLAPTSFSTAVPSAFKVTYCPGNNAYCGFKQKNKSGVITHEIKFVESVLSDEKETINQINQSLKRQVNTFRTTSIKMEIFDNKQYYVLRGIINFDQFKSPEYKGDYLLTYFIFQPISNNCRGFAWSELSRKEMNQVTLATEASKILNSLKFFQ